MFHLWFYFILLIFTVSLQGWMHHGKVLRLRLHISLSTNACVESSFLLGFSGGLSQAERDR